MPVVDFSNVKDFEALPASEYQATLTGVKYVSVDEAKNAKFDYVNLEFTVQDEGEYQGRKQFRNLSMGPDALWAYKRAMISLGTDPEVFVGPLDPKEVAEANLGAECIIEVEIQAGSNPPRNNVKDIRPLGFV